MTAGQGTQRGCFINTRSGGDQNHGTFEGMVSQNGDQTVVVGTWKFTAGSGRFAGIAGSGSFRTTASASGDLEVVWDGSCALP